MTVTAPPEVCGPQTRRVCEWVWERTDGSAAAASAADWLVGRPLAILGVLVGGWVLRWVVRRLVTRAVRRVLAVAPLLPGQNTFGDPRLDLAAMPGGPPAEEARRETRARAVSVAISSSLSGLVWVMVLIAVCGIVGLDLGPVIASAGLAGVALAFGAQSLVQDLLGGLFILLEDHFGIGDEVDLGDAVGVVERISLRETVLRGLDGTVWHVRNGEIERVGNHSQVWSAAVIDVEVVHGTDVPAASALMAGAAAAVAATAPWRDQVIGPPQVLGVQALSGDGLTLRLLMRTLAGSHFAVERALRERVAVAFGEAGVEFAARRLSGQIHRRSA
jgi:small conductance mechanosensitive channel